MTEKANILGDWNPEEYGAKERTLETLKTTVKGELPK
jgi:hypothetical protein